MKKLLSLVLICAMGFGMISCVESEESQSVTELRNAKAEQLKALVNLYNAQAEAARITAQAEAALKAAEAAYQQALADGKEQDNKQAAELFALELEKIKATYEAEIMRQKGLLAQYEKTLMDNLAKLETSLEAQLISLYNTYSSYATTLNTAKENLIDAKSQLVKVENQIITIKEAAETEIAKQEKIIAEQEEVIATEEAKLALYNNHEYAGMNIDSLEMEIVKANMAWRNAKIAYQNNEAKAVTEAATKAGKARADLVNEIGEKNFEVNGDWVIDINVDRGSGNKWVNENGSEIGAFISIDVDESALDTWKNSVLNTNLEDGVATATKELEQAEATLKAFQGFKADFEKAEAARAALYAYDQALANYDQTSETVENAQLRVDYIPSQIKLWEGYLEISTAQLDTLNKVDLAKFTTEDYDEWNFGFWRITYDMNNSMNAFRSALTDQEAKLEVLETAKENLEAAQDAKEALTEEATEAEVEAADLAIENAEKGVADAEKEVKAAQEAVKAAYDKVVYEAEIIYEEDKYEVDWYKESLKDWEEKLAKAKENKAALISAYPAAKEAIATLNEMFGDESEFAKFWEENNFDHYLQGDNNVRGSADRVTFRHSSFLKDDNNDNIPDMNLNPDGTVVDGLYIQGTKSYYDFTAAQNRYYLTKDEKYVSPDYDAMVAHYTTLVANAKDKLNDANDNLAMASEWKTNWDAKEKELRDFVAAKNAEIKDVQALVDAYYEAKEAAEKANDAVTELQGKLSAIEDLLKLAKGQYAPGNGATIERMIEIAEGNITAAEGKIAAAQAAIETQEAILASDQISWNNRTEYKEALIAELKANIEKYTAQVELYTKLVEDAKAALDAAMSAADAE